MAAAPIPTSAAESSVRTTRGRAPPPARPPARAPRRPRFGLAARRLQRLAHAVELGARRDQVVGRRLLRRHRQRRLTARRLDPPPPPPPPPPRRAPSPPPARRAPPPPLPAPGALSPQPPPRRAAPAAASFSATVAPFSAIACARGHRLAEAPFQARPRRRLARNGELLLERLLGAGLLASMRAPLLRRLCVALSRATSAAAVSTPAGAARAAGAAREAGPDAAQRVCASTSPPPPPRRRGGAGEARRPAGWTPSVRIRRDRDVARTREQGWLQRAVLPSPSRHSKAMRWRLWPLSLILWAYVGCSSYIRAGVRP